MVQMVRLFLIFLLVTGFLAVVSPGRAQEGNSLYTEGNQILDANGNPVIITGISWFGMETENFAPHGLWARSLDSFLDQIVEMGFNTIRLPFSNELFDPSSQPNGINYDLNPDLEGLNGLEIMDQIIAGAGQRGLKVILDRHRPDSHAQSELWYTPQISEERWIADWVMLAERYAGDDTVIGADLHNEPRGAATWGSGDESTDWRLAAERAGNAILEANPNLLIIVQGVEQYQGEYYWWGGNLMGVGEYPVRLNVPGRLVYSPHTYGPGVYPQSWFNDPSFPQNMPEIWDSHWGYVQKQGLAPVIIGEFGGRSVKDDREGVWQRTLVSYLKENQIGYLYWSLNPNSGDTGGVLLDDWQTVDPDKEALLNSYQGAPIGSGEPAPTSAGTKPSPAEPTSTERPAPATDTAPAAPPPTHTALALAESPDLEVRYHTSNQAERSGDTKPEFIIANHSPAEVNLQDVEIVYWFRDDPGQSYTFYCDWAQVGCENLSGEFDSLGDGLYALHVRFGAGAGTVQPGKESGEIKLRFNRADWSERNQADDYSFAATDGYEATERVGLYVNGALVRGRPPGETGASPTEASPDAGATPLASPITGSPTGTSLASGTNAMEEVPDSRSAPEKDNPQDESIWIASALALIVGFTLAAFYFRRKMGG